MILIPIPVPGYDSFPNNRIVNFLRHAVEGNGCSREIAYEYDQERNDIIGHFPHDPSKGPN